MLSTPSRIKRQEPVFKTPMTYTPRVLGENGKPTPSPSRAELWKQQLGLDDDPTGGGRDNSDSDSDQENLNPSANISMVEYRTLQRELDERNVQRDDLLFTVKTLTDKNKQYKCRLEREESTKRQHMKILCKTQETQIQEKENLITNLQGLLEEQEARVQQLEQVSGPLKCRPLGDHTNIPTMGGGTTVRLIEEVKRLQAEKVDLTRRVEEHTHLCVQAEGKARGQTEGEGAPAGRAGEHGTPAGRAGEQSGQEATLASLQAENTDLRDTIERLHKNGQLSDAGPCTTDTEKQVDLLQRENGRLHEELTDLRQVYSQSADMVKQGSIQYQQLDEELTKAKLQNTSLEKLLSVKSEELASQQTKHRQDQTTLRSEGQATARKMRELQAELMALHAKEPEVITKIKRVEVQTESEELKIQYSRCQQENALLQTESEELKTRYSRCQQENGLLQTESEELKTQYSRCQQENGRLQTESDELKTQYSRCQQKNDLLQSQVERLRSEVTEVKGQLKNAEMECKMKTEQMATLEQETETVTHQLTLEIESVKAEKEEAVRSVKRDLEQTMESLQHKYDQVCHRIQQLRPIIVKLVKEYVVLQKQARQFPTMIKETVSQVRKETTRAIHDIHDYNQELVKKYHREMALRKKFHNELVELKGNIRVFCRVRPKIREDGSGNPSQNVVTYDADDDGLIYIDNKGRRQVFEMDKVFTETSKQTQVFNEVQSLVTSCIDGYNVCIFAYGQTGSGKTYTMEGSADDPGINQRALKELFQEIARRGCDWSYTITVSVLEIYNEVIRDLLVSSEDVSVKLDVKMNTDGHLYVPGLCITQVCSVDNVNRVFSIGQKNRATATTNMNEHSSRSHALLCVTVAGVNKTTNVKTTGKLNLVDLAGSERVSKSGADGTRLKEAQSINKSLSSLGDVIYALRSKQSHVPYRNSKLTYLLQDSLGGDSKTLMIVQVAPVEKNLGETVCSLNFAQRVRTVELGQASRRVENGDAEGDHCGSPLTKSSTPSRGTPSRPAHLTPSRTTPLRSGTTPLASACRGSKMPKVKLNI